MLVIKLPADPSRHRVAVWRELRKIGALSLGQGVWAVPDVPVFADGVRRALQLTEAAGGQGVTLEAVGRSPEDAARFRELFNDARSADWTEFLADCGKFEEEIANRDLTARDVFVVPEATEAGTRLSRCVAVCEGYAERVFGALHGSG